MLSLPERSDKRDTLVVQASLSNFSVTFLDGVDGASVSEKALPYVSSGTISIPQNKVSSNLLSRNSSREQVKRAAGEDTWTLLKSNSHPRSNFLGDFLTYGVVEWSERTSRLP